MALVATQDNRTDGIRRVAYGTRTGTRTAADFTVTVGFKPKVVRVTNLTSRVSAEHVVDAALDGGSNGKSLVTGAAGARTYANAGITVGERSFSVVAATAGLESDNCDLIWEAVG